MEGLEFGGGNLIYYAAMRILFMGSSSASATCLYALLREKELEVVGVVTPPDRPAGRGKALTPCPCKAYAMERDLPNVISSGNVNSAETMAEIRSLNPDAIVVVAFGQFLKAPILELPPHGCINCHFSLLPKYRGASPVVAAIAAGEKLTGVTVMKMGLGMDDGPILYQSYEPIYSDTTGGRLMDLLAIAGGGALVKTLKSLAAGETVNLVEQNPSEATFAWKLKKTDGLIAWNEDVIVIDRKIRAYSPWPGCFTFLPEKMRKGGFNGRLVVTRAAIVSDMEEAWKDAESGTVLAIRKNGFVVKCGHTALMPLEVKPEGSALMDCGAFLCGKGRPLQPGDRLLDS